MNGYVVIGIIVAVGWLTVRLSRRRIAAYRAWKGREMNG